MQNFTAFDFETANTMRHSACQLGVAVVRDGVIVDNRSWLIRPPSLQFLDEFIDIHHITPDMVRDQPTFADLWPEIRPFFDESKLLVAHNVSFDRGVFEALCEKYDLKKSRYKYKCTVEIARQTWPELPRHKLNIVCEHLGIALNHHEARSDARACAEIALRAQGAVTGYTDGVPRFTSTPIKIAIN